MWAARIKDGKFVKGDADSTSPIAPRKSFRGVVLGIDPSLRGTGLAVVAFDEPGQGRLRASRTVKPPKAADLPQCLGCIVHAIEEMILQHKPDVVAIEETIYVQNFRTTQKLGAARGAAIGQAAFRGVEVHEYPPLRIKQAVVGYGRASKEQVARQMSSLLGLREDLPFDEADAAAAAYCHALTARE
jgi:crossover junction endodeoxyribonuclease RuvC